MTVMRTVAFHRMLTTFLVLVTAQFAYGGKWDTGLPAIFPKLSK